MYHTFIYDTCAYNVRMYDTRMYTMRLIIELKNHSWNEIREKGIVLIVNRRSSAYHLSFRF